MEGKKGKCKTQPERKINAFITSKDLAQLSSGGTEPRLNSIGTVFKESRQVNNLHPLKTFSK